MFSSLLQRCWAENGKDCGGHEGYWNHSKIQWENRKPWSTKWIKYSYLNALALSGPEWPRWKQLNFFSFRCRLVREESLHFHNAQNSFSFRARWVLAICTCWACTLKLCQSFPSLDPEISEKYPDPTRWWASAMLQLDGALWRTCPFLTKNAPSNRQFQNVSYPFISLHVTSSDAFSGWFKTYHNHVKFWVGEHQNWQVLVYGSSGYSGSNLSAIGAKISYVVCGYVVSRLTLNVFGLAVSTFQQCPGCRNCWSSASVWNLGGPRDASTSPRNSNLKWWKLQGFADGFGGF